MKKHNLIYVALLVSLMLNIGGFVFSVFREAPQPQQGTSRITNILDEHGDRLKSIAAQNITSVNGAATVLVDTLQSPIQFENYSGHIRWNTTSSRLEYSDDDSATWLDMITATDITYENLSTNSDVGTASNQVAQGDHLHDLRYYTESEIDLELADINDDLSDLFDEFDPAIGHEHTGAAEDGRKVTHSNLSSLTSDDHTQYALLAGRSGGQIIIGGTGSGDDLTLQSTSHATKGSIIFGNTSTIYDVTNEYLGIGTATPDTELHVAGDIKQRIVSSNVANPPTAAELNTLFVNATTVGDGWTVYIDDSDSENFYQVVASGTLWFIFTAAKGL